MCYNTLHPHFNTSVRFVYKLYMYVYRERNFDEQKYAQIGSKHQNILTELRKVI